MSDVTGRCGDSGFNEFIDYGQVTDGLTVNVTTFVALAHITEVFSLVTGTGVLAFKAGNLPIRVSLISVLWSWLSGLDYPVLALWGRLPSERSPEGPDC